MKLFINSNRIRYLFFKRAPKISTPKEQSQIFQWTGTSAIYLWFNAMCRIYITLINFEYCPMRLSVCRTTSGFFYNLLLKVSIPFINSFTWFSGIMKMIPSVCKVSWYFSAINYFLSSGRLVLLFIPPLLLLVLFIIHSHPLRFQNK